MNHTRTLNFAVVAFVLHPREAKEVAIPEPAASTQSH